MFRLNRKFMLWSALVFLLLLQPSVRADEAGMVPGQARAGVGTADASWHLGASAGQFAGTSVAHIEGGRGVDPYFHATRKIGSDLLGTRILTRALIVEDGEGDRIAVVANDLYLPQDLLHRRVSQLLAEHDRLISLGLKEGAITGITAENLAMTVSHSHTSAFYSTPSVGPWVFQDVFDLRFYEYMAERMASALIQAASRMEPVRMGGATIHSNDIRSHTYGAKHAYDGTPAGQPHDYTTQQAHVLRFDRLDGSRLANWVIFGVHPEWVWGEEIVNGDITHAVMRMLDRETGGLTVMSQSETGTSGPHKDERAHLQSARREFQESNGPGYDRAARLLSDTLMRALDGIGAGKPQDLLQFVPMRSNFDVASVSMRFAPPSTRPVPGASNCNSERVFQFDPRVPVPELPECKNEASPLTDAIREPFTEFAPFQPSDLVAELNAFGVPVPVSYSIPSLGALEEVAAVHLQVFRLGDIVALMCPCEQFTDTALNLQSRLDRVEGNIHTGWDWTCLQPGHEDDALCVSQRRTYRGWATPAMMQGSLDDPGKVARMRAQIHNDAAGWEELLQQRSPGVYGQPRYSSPESEPEDPSEIKGNFTHEEFPQFGYGMVVPLGMVNDYWGYMPAYREYRAHDHYRKSLAGLGPHGADFLATRLARLAASLNGGPAVAASASDQAYQEEYYRAEAFAQALGNGARSWRTAYEATLPADGGKPRIVAQPRDTEHFSAATIRFVGGSNYWDMPQVRVERLVSGTPEAGEWETYGTQDGEVQLQLQFPRCVRTLTDEDVPPGDFAEGQALLEKVIASAADAGDCADLALWRAGQFEWTWTANFEVFISELEDLGNRPSATPPGTYRFVVEGQHYSLPPQPAAYELVSEPFAVKPFGGLTIAEYMLGDSSIRFVPGPLSSVSRFRPGASDDRWVDVETPVVVGPIDYPDSYEGGTSWTRSERNLHGAEQYCHRCSFRPWLDTGRLVSASISVENPAGRVSKTAATPESGSSWVAPVSYGDRDRVFVAAGDLVDVYGGTNREEIVLFEGGCPDGNGGQGKGSGKKPGNGKGCSPQ